MSEDAWPGCTRASAWRNSSEAWAGEAGAGGVEPLARLRSAKLPSAKLPSANSGPWSLGRSPAAGLAIAAANGAEARSSPRSFVRLLRPPPPLSPGWAVAPLEFGPASSPGVGAELALPSEGAFGAVPLGAAPFEVVEPFGRSPLSEGSPTSPPPMGLPRNRPSREKATKETMPRAARRRRLSQLGLPLAGTGAAGAATSSSSSSMIGKPSRAGREAVPVAVPVAVSAAVPAAVPVPEPASQSNAPPRSLAWGSTSISIAAEGPFQFQLGSGWAGPTGIGSGPGLSPSGLSPNRLSPNGSSRPFPLPPL